MPYRDVEKQRAAQRRHYVDNKPYYIEKSRRRNRRIRIELRAKLVAYLFEHPCVDCGEDDPVVLDSDHVGDDKTATISDLVRWT